MTVYAQHFGRRLRNLRKQHRMTQEDLAPLLGMKRSNLSMIEKGSVPVRIDLLEKISAALKVDMGYWFDNLAVSDLSPNETNLIRLLRDGEHLAAIHLIVMGISPDESE